MAKVLSVLCLFSLRSVNCHFDTSEPCTSINGGPGVCIGLYSCQPFLALTRESVSNPITTWMLRQAHCGFEGNNPKICCPVDETDTSNNIDLGTKPTTTKKVKVTNEPPTTPTLPQETTTSCLTPSTLPPTMSSTLPPTTSTLPPTTSTLPPSTSTLPPSTSNSPPKLTLPPVITEKRSEEFINYDLLSLFGETCTTIFNNTGSCSDLYLCEPLLEVVKEARNNPAAARMVKQAHCGFKGSIPQVCCPLPGQTSNLISSTPATSNKAGEDPKAGGDFLDSFPEPPVCGTSGVKSSNTRVVGGVPAKLGAFPWMALLAYRDESVASGVRWKCGGTLISPHHVLTAAHCIHHQEDELFLVRLGELDLAREDEGATPVDVPIKELVKHEQYSRNNPVLYDIGVLVLERDVAFTELIKPICLVPDKKWRSSNFEAHNPFVAGWGDTKWQGVSATHLQVAQLPVLSDAACEKAYSEHLLKSRGLFSTRAMCAGYVGGKIDSCSGDSGGPLMLPLPNEKFQYYFYEIGVVSFGRKCAVPGSPGVYTRVAAYLPWLEEKVLGRTRPAS